MRPSTEIPGLSLGGTRPNPQDGPCETARWRKSEPIDIADANPLKWLCRRGGRERCQGKRQYHCENCRQFFHFCPPPKVDLYAVA